MNFVFSDQMLVELNVFFSVYIIKYYIHIIMHSLILNEPSHPIQDLQETNCKLLLTRKISTYPYIDYSRDVNRHI